MNITKYPIPSNLINYVDQISHIDLDLGVRLPIYAWSRGHIIIMESGYIHVEIPLYSSFNISDAAIWGPQLKPGVITSSSSGARGWVVMLAAGATPSFMGESCESVLNDIVSVSKVLPDFRFDYENNDVPYSVVIDLLIRLIIQFDMNVPMDDSFRIQLMNTLSRQPVSDVSKVLGISPSTLERKTKHLFGVSPKTLARLQRFYTCFPLMEHFCDTDVAALAGYYDQSHYIRDFKMFTGITPKQFRCLLQSDYMSLYVEESLPCELGAEIASSNNGRFKL